jgi:hypothetical protein
MIMLYFMYIGIWAETSDVRYMKSRIFPVDICSEDICPDDICLQIHMLGSDFRSNTCLPGKCIYGLISSGKMSSGQMYLRADAVEAFVNEYNLKKAEIPYEK